METLALSIAVYSVAWIIILADYDYPEIVDYVE